MGQTAKCECNELQKNIKPFVEALLFVSGHPLKSSEIAREIGVTVSEVDAIIGVLEKELGHSDRGVMIQRVAGGFRMATKEQMSAFVQSFLENKPPSRLSRSALETLAIISYRQPITKPEIDSIRGVKSDSPLSTLLERGLIKEVGRKHVIGRPLMYGTTPEFLLYFGLNTLEDLPQVDGPSDIPKMLNS